MKKLSNQIIYHKIKASYKYLLLILLIAHNLESYSQNSSAKILTMTLKNNQSICYGTVPEKLTLTCTYDIPPHSRGETIYIQQSTNKTTWTEISSFSTTLQLPTLTQTTYYRTITRTYTNVISNIVTIEVSEPLISGSINNSNQTICYDTAPPKITCSLPTGGKGEYTYQWKKSTNGTDWVNIMNATTDSYQPEKLTQTCHFKRQAINILCEGSEESNVVTFTIYSSLVSGIIRSNQTINYNTIPSKVIGELPTGGNGIFTYQWQYSEDNISWSDVSYATGSDYQSTALRRTTYIKRITRNGCDSKESNVITITVYGELTAGSIDYSQNVCYNSTPKEIVGTLPTGGDGNYTYKWQQNINNTRWEYIDGASSINIKPTALTKTTSFKRIVSSGGSSKESNVIIVGVYDELGAGIIGYSQTIYNNSTPKKLTGETSIGGNGIYTYQWKKSTDNVNWNNISEAISKDYQPEPLKQTTYYKRITSNECGTTESNIVTISVYSSLEPGEISSNQIICYNTAPKRLTGTLPSGGDGSYDYQWKISLDNIVWTPITGATSTTLQPPVLQFSTYYKREVKSGSNINESNIIEITVIPKLSENAIVSSQTICYNTNPQVLVGSEITGGNGIYTYQWKKSTDGINWISVSNGTDINFQPELLKQNTYYKRTVITECKTVDSNEILIVVLPEFRPGEIGNNQTIIFGNVPQILGSSTSPTGGNGEYTYQWQQSTDGNNWVDIMTEKSSSYQPGILSKTTHYRRQTSDSKCGVDVTNIVTITVTTENEIIGTIGSSQTICFNTSPKVLTSSSMNESEVVYKQWQQSTDGIKWNDITGETEKTYSPPLLTNTTYYRLRVVTASNGDVVSNIVIITVLDEFNKGTLSDNQSICTNNKPKPITTIIPPNHEVINRWESSYNGTTWNVVPNEKHDYIELPIIAKTAFYRKIVTSACGELATSPVLITVNPILTGGNIQESQTIDYDNVPKQIKGNMPTGGNGTYTYYWEKSYDGLDWNQIPNETGINLQPSALQQTTHIRRVVSSGDCSIAFSNPIIITVTTKLGAGYIGNNQTICYGAVPIQISGTDATGGIEIYSYSWERSTDGEAWEVLFGKTDKDLIPVSEATETTYFRRKVTSGNMSNYSNTVRIDVLAKINTPEITYKKNYCKGDDITINSSLENVSWYDASGTFINSNKVFNTKAETSTKYYYQIKNGIGCRGEMTEVDIIVDYINVEIETSVFDRKKIENGKKVAFSPNVESNTDLDGIIYKWEFEHQDKGWYETMYDTKPEQYFHWKGWYDVILEVSTTTGCKFTKRHNDFLYVMEETPDTRNKSGIAGRESVDSEFGITNQVLFISTYPNPVKNDLYIKIENSEESLNIALYDAIGKIVYSDIIEGGELSIKSLNMSAFAQGVYILVVDNQYKYKIIKQ